MRPSKFVKVWGAGLLGLAAVAAGTGVSGPHFLGGTPWRDANEPGQGKPLPVALAIGNYPGAPAASGSKVAASKTPPTVGRDVAVSGSNADGPTVPSSAVFVEGTSARAHARRAGEAPTTTDPKRPGKTAPAKHAPGTTVPPKDPGDGGSDNPPVVVVPTPPSIPDPTPVEPKPDKPKKPKPDKPKHDKPKGDDPAPATTTTTDPPKQPVIDLPLPDLPGPLGPAGPLGPGGPLGGLIG